MELQRRLFHWFSLALVSLGVIGAISTSYLPKPLDGAANPVADSLVFTALYAAVFLGLLSAAVLLGYGLTWLRVRAIRSAHHWPILRQGGLTSLGLTALLMLSGYRVLTWWDASLLVVALVLVELSFHTKYLPKN